MIFANTNKEITLIYSSEKHIGRQILAYANTENIPIHDIDISHVELSATHWADLAAKMEVEVQDLVNTESPEFLQKFGTVNQLSERDWLKLLVHNPGILMAPIVMKGDKIVMMKNPHEMLYFVS